MQSSIVSKILSLLTIISETRKPMTFSEVVLKSGMSKSTIHRLLNISIEEQLVQYDRQKKAYLMGPKIFELVRNTYSGNDIQEIALDEMTRLHGLFGANVTIGIPSGAEVAYLRIVEATYSAGYGQRPGMREPIHCSASGKALMAFLPDKMVAAKMQNYQFNRFTDRTITNLEDFNIALNEVRECGFAKNDREEYDHFVGISAPIFNFMKEPIAVLNIWSDHSRHSLDDMLAWGHELRESSDRVTALIGGASPELKSLTSA